MTFISVVSPVYKAEKIIPELVKRIEGAVLKISPDFEIILVEDGGPDASWEVIENIANKNPRVKGIKLSRNFGQHYAITAGLDQSKGDWVVVIDCDLQDIPEEIEKLYHKAREGFDVVLARRNNRKDPFLKRFFSLVFYRILGYLTGTKYDPSVANFGIYSRKVINAVSQMREYIRVFPVMVKWLGFPTTKVNVKHDRRFKGKTSYNFRKLLHLAMDIILAYSDKPIRLAIKLGLLISLSSFVFAIVTLIRYFTGAILVPGYASVIFSLWFLSGIILVVLGAVGLYVGKTFDGVKNRPIYVIENVTTSKD